LARVSRLERDVLRFFFAAGADGVGVAVSEEDDDDDCDADCESDSESGRERVRVASGKGVTVTSAPRGLHISASLASVASSVLTGLSFGSLSSRGGAPVTATDDKPAAAPAATTAADSNDDDNIDGRWVRVEDAPTWTLDVAVPDARTRLLLHVMCRYYGLVSRSHDSDEHGCRVTRVAMPRALREALLVSAAAAAAVDDAEDLSCDDDDDDDADAESDADAKAAARWRASCTDGAARLLRRSEAARQRRCALRRRQRRRLRAAAAVATGDEVFEMDDIAVALSSPPTRLSSSTPSENDQDEDDGFGVGVGDNGRRRRRRAGDVPAFLEMPAIPPKCQELFRWPHPEMADTTAPNEDPMALLLPTAADLRSVLPAADAATAATAPATSPTTTTTAAASGGGGSPHRLVASGAAVASRHRQVGVLDQGDDDDDDDDYDAAAVYASGGAEGATAGWGVGAWGSLASVSWGTVGSILETVKKQTEAVVDVYRRDIGEFVTIVAEEATAARSGISSEGGGDGDGTGAAVSRGTTAPVAGSPAGAERGDGTAVGGDNDGAADDYDDEDADEDGADDDGGLAEAAVAAADRAVAGLERLADRAEGFLERVTFGLGALLSSAVTLTPPPEEAAAAARRRVFFDRKSATLAEARRNPQTFLEDPLQAATGASDSYNEDDSNGGDGEDARPRRKRPAPPPSARERAARYAAFAEAFSVGAHSAQIARLLDEDRDLQRLMDRIVPTQVGSEDFWARYFFKVAEIEREEEMRRRLMT
ncbi:hypothetical protein HK405_009584, partial [Cladochytrium tenue]